MKTTRGNKFLSGFGNEDFMKEYHIGDSNGLQPGSIFSENIDSYKLEIGVPFMSKKDFKIRLEGNQLIIQGTKVMNAEADERNRVYKGVFFLPSDITANEIAARFKNGLLEITMPKKKIEKETEMIVIQD